MNAASLGNAKAVNRFLDDAFAFFDGEQYERFVLKALNLLTIVVITDPALEADVPAACAILDSRPQS
jgi:hypothetical protein